MDCLVGGLEGRVLAVFALRQVVADAEYVLDRFVVVKLFLHEKLEVVLLLHDILDFRGE
jgi:hypothetical protein